MDKQHSPTDMTLLDEMKKHYPVIEYDVPEDLAKSDHPKTRLLLLVNQPDDKVVFVYQDWHVLAYPPNPSLLTSVERLADRIQSGRLKGIRVIQNLPPLLTMEASNGI